MSKSILKSELQIQKTALTLALQRIDTLMQVVDQLPSDSSDFKTKSLDQSDTESMIEDVLDKVERLPNFDKSFLESLDASLSKYGKLTEKQDAALRNLHRKFCREHY